MESCADCAIKSNWHCTIPGSGTSLGAGRPCSLPSQSFAAAGLEPSRRAAFQTGDLRAMLKVEANASSLLFTAPGGKVLFVAELDQEMICSVVLRAVEVCTDLSWNCRTLHWTPWWQRGMQCWQTWPRVPDRERPQRPMPLLRTAACSQWQTRAHLAAGETS